MTAYTREIVIDRMQERFGYAPDEAVAKIMEYDPAEIEEAMAILERRSDVRSPSYVLGILKKLRQEQRIDVRRRKQIDPRTEKQLRATVEIWRYGQTRSPDLGGYALPCSSCAAIDGHADDCAAGERDERIETGRWYRRNHGNK